MNQDLRFKLLAAIGAWAVAGSLLFVAADPIASGYEISAYQSHPAPFWFLVLAGLLVGQIVIFESALLDERSRYWKWGFGLLIAANAVLLLLPALRYHLYARGDMLSFIGMIREIQELGAVPRSNYYPNLHLLALTLSFASGVDVSTLVNLLPPLFSILFAVSLYLLLDVLFADDRKALFVLPIGALLLYKFENLLFSPNVAAFMTVPFVLAVLGRIYASDSPTRFKLPFLVVILSLVFYHPITTLFLVGLFVLLKLAFAADRRIEARSVGRENTPVVIASIAFVVFFAWYYSFESIIGSTTLLLAALLGVGGGTPEVAKITSVFARATPDLVDIALVGLYTYGLIAAIFGLAVTFVADRLYAARTADRRLDAIEMFLGLGLAVFFVGGVAAFFVDFRFGSTRFFRYVRLFGSIIIGLGLFDLAARAAPESIDRYLRPVAYTAFFVLAAMSVFMLYGSPISNDRNLQVTEAEIEGMEWLLDNRDPGLLIDELGTSQYRIYSAEPRPEVSGRNVRQFETQPPDHFAYDNASALDQPPETTGQQRYLAVTRLGRIRNPEFFPNYRPFWRHTPDDFRGLEYDSDVDRVFDGGEFDAYLVRDVGASANNSTAE